MNNNKIYPSIFILIGSAVIIVSTYKYANILLDAQWLFYGAGVFCFLGVLTLRNKKSSEALKIEYKERQLDERKERLEAYEVQLEQRLNLVTERNQDLLNKLKIYNEWTEFPEMMDNSVQEKNMSLLSERDKEVVIILKKESEYIFNKIIENKYKSDGDLSWNMMVDDIIDLITRIARVYQPDSKFPLLETNIEKLIRATNRISFQIIVLLDQMPLDIKEYNIRKVYDYVDSASHLFQSYKKVEPFLPAAKNSLYAARIAMGSNPVTLAISAIAAELAKEGGKKVGSLIAERYGVGLLHDIISIIGNEVANTFGGDFRHREINWLYGAELTDIFHNFPVSKEILEYSLKEVGSLALRSEYDRIYFYRCLSSKKSAIESLSESKNSKNNHSLDYLDLDERQEIAKKLEHIFNDFVLDQKIKKIKIWVSGVEKRLGLKLNIKLLNEENKNSNNNKSDETMGTLKEWQKKIPDIFKK